MVEATKPSQSNMWLWTRVQGFRVVSAKRNSRFHWVPSPGSEGRAYKVCAVAKVYHPKND